MAWQAAPNARKNACPRERTASRISASMAVKRWRREARKTSGPPRQTILPLTALPRARPLMGWLTTARMMEAAISSRAQPR